MKNGDTVLDRRYPKSEPWRLYHLHECYEWRIQRRSLTLTRDWTRCEWIWRGGWIYRRRNRRSIQPWINNRNRRPLCMRPLLSILGLSVCVCVCTEKRRYDGFGKKCRKRSGVEHRYKEERDTCSKILWILILRHVHSTFLRDPLNGPNMYYMFSQFLIGWSLLILFD